MLQQIFFKNYKAFKEGSIKLKPITILLGANSVGKSSIIQLLLMLQQTALSRKYKSALRLHGECIGLGENENIFRDKDISNDLVLTFQFKDKDLLNSFKNELIEELTHSILRPLSLLQRFYLHTKENKKITSLFSSKHLRTNKKGALNSKKEFLELYDELSSIYTEMLKSKDVFEKEYIFAADIKKLPNFDLNRKSDYGIIYDFLQNCSQLKSDIFDLSYNIKNIVIKEESVLKVSRIKLVSEGKTLLDLELFINIENNNYEMISLKSDYINFDNMLSEDSKSEFLQNINYDSTIFSIIANKDIERNYYDLNTIISPSQTLLNILSHSINTVSSNFSRESINYVSPLRAHPKRYYFLDKANINTYLDTLDGDSLTEILKENEVVRKKVNQWFKNFNLAINVSTLEDVIHKLKVRQNSLSLDITDVGFGISQVLPVIVQGFLSRNSSLTIIEQPEIHLHPKMQADLADLFIDIVYENNKLVKSLLIETHSEYLLKRLRRRMSEGDKISPEEVAIYFIHPKNENDTARIDEKNISSEGAFEWPQDFYAGELLKDTVEFIKNQEY